MAAVAATIGYVAEPSIDFNLIPELKDADRQGGKIMADGQLRPIDDVERSLGLDAAGTLSVSGYVTGSLSEEQLGEIIGALASDIARAWVTGTEIPEDQTISDLVVLGDEAHRGIYALVRYGDNDRMDDRQRVGNVESVGEFDPGWGDFGGRIHATVSDVSVDSDA
jgi:hypothetical protein